jgi:3-oxoacyl-[acyl-carrier-protein] synthase-3
MSPTDLGVPAVLQALERAARRPDEVDTLIFASTDTDQLEPATANVLQHKLGMERVNAFDVSNACNSFLQAVNVANSLIATGASRCVAICASELGSHWICPDLKDRDELRYKIGALTLGDAAAAVIMEPADGVSGISEINLFSIGEYWELCHVPENIDWRKQATRNIHGWFYLDMSGLAKVVRPLSIQYFTQYRDYRKKEHDEKDFKAKIDKVIPHQISRRLIAEIATSLHADEKLVAITADEYGNTASAAIPFTLHQMIQAGELQLGSGQDVLLFGTASGLGMGHVRVRL